MSTVSPEDYRYHLIRKTQDHSTPKVHQRASVLFDNERVILGDFDEKHDQASFYVAGRGDTYLVEVAYVKNDPVPECDCPYDGPGYCKHSIAVLFWLLNYDAEKATTRNKQSNKVDSSEKSPKTDQPSDSEEGSQHKKDGWVILENAHDLEEYLKDGWSFYLDNLVEVENIDPEQFRLLVSPKKHKRGLLKNVVEIKRGEDKHFYISCTCEAFGEKLCFHQKSAIKHLVVFRRSPFLLRNVEKNLENKNQVCREYGVNSEKELEQEFIISLYNPGEINYTPKDPKRKKLPQYLDFNKEINLLSEEDRTRIITSAINQPGNEEGLATGYILRFFNMNNPVPFQLIPVRGTPNKKGNRLQKHLQFLSAIPDQELVEVGLPFFQAREMDDFKEDNLSQHDFFIQLGHYHSMLEKLFPLLQGKILMVHPPNSNFAKSRLKPASILTGIHPELYYIFEENASNYRLEAHIKVDGQEELLDESWSEGRSDVHPLVFKDSHNRLLIPNSPDKAVDFVKASIKPLLELPKGDLNALMEKIIIPLNQKYPVEMKTANQPADLKPEQAVKKVYLSELDQYVLFTPKIDYGYEEVEPFHRGNVWVSKDGQTYRLRRDQEAEEELLQIFEEAHPKFKKQRNRELFYLTSEELMEDMWFFNFFEELQQKGVEVYGREKLNNFKMNLNKPNFKVSVKSGIDWFDTQIEITFGEQKVPLESLKEAALQGHNHVKLDDGSLGVLPDEWLNKLEPFFRSGELDSKKGTLKHSKAHFNLIDKLHDHIDNSKVLQELEKKKQKLLTFDKIKNKPLPKNLKANFRDYQQAGYNWLHFLEEFGFGGCLADDMGLGKTLQVLSFLLKQKQRKKRNATHLIVVPNTLVFNWLEESRKFTPDLEFLVHHGPNREKSNENFNKYDVILTTYGTMISDIEILKDFQYEYIILDESQAIKNPASQRFKAVRLLQGRNRLVLTGTPIENNTYDLFAQMQFLNPGLLGNQTSFKDTFSDPIDKEGREDVAEHLRTLIHPFILRRTKEQVAKELPEKSENVLYCEMRSEQRAVYDYYKNKYRDYLLGKIEEEGLNNSKMHVLEGLNKLRQISNSPALLKDESYANHSVKLELLKNHIRENHKGHKILVFSQFVNMLELIKAELDSEEIQYAYLDGQTKNRQEIVEQFQNDENLKVFLISLKAGGQGLNLTAADYVYLVDPWWNPAVENQAIDRTYRIGQDKHVFAYKMICNETVEEKILKLQEQKKSLSSELVKTDDSFIKSLEKEDIKQLFG